MKMTIPFQGFYSTVHDMYCEAAVTRDFQDSYGDVYDDFWEKSNVDWPEARRRYAIEYADGLLHALGEARADLKLGREEREAISQAATLYSPREYNFANDSIHIDLPQAYAEKLLNIGRQEYLLAMQESWENASTAYDGYRPFYSYREFEQDFNSRDFDSDTLHFTVKDVMRLILEADSEEWKLYIMEDAICCGYLDFYDLAHYTGTCAELN